ncbi:hypothetical protein JavanS54_0004 [Streptococcus satellite phage Javan54]|nr:hypothetical protein [Streptococcus agalactiae]QBX11061.1 hypothetical protein JavanS54_0004 [Streptococcus satellite phage Javan54]CCW41044.1 hypothetical protein MSA_21900 [Streptococcus agalactiae ILRI005]
MNQKQKEWDEFHPIPDFSAMSEALVSEKFAKELSKELEKRRLFPK